MRGHAAITVLAERYQREWVSELHARGVVVNGVTADEREAQRRLAAFKARKLPHRTGRKALEDAAKAFERAKRKGYVRIDPQTGFFVCTGR